MTPEGVDGAVCHRWCVPDAAPTRVALLITCLVDVFEPDVGDATVRVLEASRCEVDCPLGQTCCGQPAWNSGYAADSARVARTTLDALEGALDAGAEAIVVPAGSCTTMVKVFWPELFELVDDDETAARARRVAAHTFELSQFVAARDLPRLSLGRDLRVAWHHSCHLLRELHVHDEPLELLDQIEGCERREWADAERCCGFGGMFSFKLPETAEAMADQKLGSLDPPDVPAVDIVVGADSSCLLHLRGRGAATGQPIQTRHIAEVLAAALADERIDGGEGSIA
jgi:L-lactate dehydrogenase complex protein LldE